MVRHGATLFATRTASSLLLLLLLFLLLLLPLLILFLLPLLLSLALQPTMGFSLLSDSLTFRPFLTQLSPPTCSHYISSSVSSIHLFLGLPLILLLTGFYCNTLLGNIYAVQQATQSFLMTEFYSSRMSAPHVSDLTGPSSGVFFTSCMCRFGMCCNMRTAGHIQSLRSCRKNWSWCGILFSSIRITRPSQAMLLLFYKSHYICPFH